MKSRFFLVAFSFLFSGLAVSQNLYPDRTTKINQKRGSVGTTTADAIATADIGKDVMGWKICNDAVNTSTYLAVGQAADVSDDGVRLGLGQCLECLNCNAALLDAMKVEGQAATNGYTVVVFRK